MSHIKSELIKFGETTSIKGVPKVFKSKDYFLKAIWLFFVLACTAVLLFLLVTLFNKFYSWPTTTKFGEKLDGKIAFPDVTLCNMNPFGNGYPSNYTFSDYVKFIDSLETLLEFYNISENAFLENIKDVPSYIVNMPKVSDTLLKDCPMFIAECILYSEAWQYMRNCTSSFTSRWNTDYYTCHTFRTNDFLESTDLIIKGMTLVLNIGPPVTDLMPFSASLTTSQASGVRIVIHPRGTPPDFKRGFSVGPGTETVVKITQKEIERLDKPHNPLGCTTQKRMPNFVKESYSRDLCIQYCTQSLLVKNCSCVASWYEIPEELNDTPLCDNLTMFNGTEELACALQFSQDEQICYATCPFPCNEIEYTSSVESSPWPPVSMQLSIYKKYIEQCIKEFPNVMERYAAYDYLSRQKMENPSEYKDSNKTFKVSDLQEVQASMLLVKFILDKDYFYSEINKPMYSWDVMVSLVGGMLSLWLGITVMTAVELLELFYLIVRGFWTKKQVVLLEPEKRVGNDTLS